MYARGFTRSQSLIFMWTADLHTAVRWTATSRCEATRASVGSATLLDRGSMPRCIMVRICTGCSTVMRGAWEAADRLRFPVRCVAATAVFAVLLEVVLAVLATPTLEIAAAVVLVAVVALFEMRHGADDMRMTCTY